MAVVECERVAGGRWLWWSVRGWQVGGGWQVGVAVVAGGRWLWWSVRWWQWEVAVVECERMGGGCGGGWQV